MKITKTHINEKNIMNIQLNLKTKNGINKQPMSCFKYLLLFILLCQLQLAVAGIAVDQQTITLKPGWNAIFVELEPVNNQITDVFSGVPVESVWRWLPKGLGSDFVVDPAEGLLSVDGWYGYFPEPRPEAFLSNLYTISANTSYLVKLDGTTNKTITITGRPILRKKKWTTNGYTLTGFPLVEGDEPSFGDFFATSEAHNDQPIYRLTQQGEWQLVANPYTEVMKSGESYWVYTEGTSKFQGLINVTVEQGESIEYRAAFTEIDIILTNLSDVPNYMSINRVNGNSMPMKFLNIDPETGEEAWPNLPNVKVYEVQPGEDRIVTLAVDRANFLEERMEQVLSVTNEQGGKVMIHAGANTIQPLAIPTRISEKLATRGTGSMESYAGLWIGTARVRGVSEAQTGGVTPESVGKPFSIRVLMHVDATGQVKLIKNVVQMWQNGTYSTSASNPDYVEVDVPGYYVLLTNDALIPNYSGITRRSGQSAGVRYSTIGYDFNGDDMLMNGEFAPNNSVNVSLLIDPEMPTNPFRHKYHPDHDNKDAQFLNFKQEAFQITREMEFFFTPNNPKYPDVADPPGWGVEEMGGIFRETIIGLHKNAIFVEGDFRLNRIASTAVLNQ
ncbi:hypothetical protein [Marinicella litoralis]|uniref:Uncharacterized protein n=1 Tax=Marinicella litoralis TaxID=644220 RepID=A0A4R6XLQ6_9GAMM|nr:hypothetical protein [Marinicella litoralis]TDR18537.1 hypothetical protein C8D91_2457 [Marinicella litoralis]